jgi:hypothetical protein
MRAAKRNRLSTKRRKRRGPRRPRRDRLNKLAHAPDARAAKRCRCGWPIHPDETLCGECQCEQEGTD